MSPVIIILVLLFVIVTIGSVLIFSKNNKKQNIYDEDGDGDDLDNVADITLIEKARASIVVYEYADELNNYRFSNDKSDTDTGIFVNWYKDNWDLGFICERITNALTLVATKNKYTTLDKRIIAICEDFMFRYRYQLLKAASLNKIPWGVNWYEFSVTSTQMMAFYMLCKNVSRKKLASKIVLLLIKNPKTSLGYNRDGINSVYLAGPWMLAKHFESTSGRTSFAKLTSTPEVQYCVKYVEFPKLSTSTQDGLHMDNSVRYHTSVVYFKYFLSLFENLSLYFYELSGTNISIDTCNKVLSYIAHPTIPLTLCGFDGRNPNLSGRTYAESKYGIEVMPFGRIIRYFLPDAFFMMRGQIDKAAFYEADQNTYDTSEYWVQFRGVYCKKRGEKIANSDLGFIHDVSQNKRVSLPTGKETTKTFYPESNTRSFVFHHDNYGMLFHEYSIPQLVPALVSEYVMIDALQQKITLISLVSNNEKPLKYIIPKNNASFDNQLEQLAAVELPANSKESYQWTYDFKAKTISASVNNAYGPYGILSQEQTVGKNKYRITYKTEDSYALLYVNGKPTIVAPTVGDSREDESITATIDKNQFKCKFNTTINQYLVAN